MHRLTDACLAWLPCPPRHQIFTLKRLCILHLLHKGVHGGKAALNRCVWRGVLYGRRVAVLSIWDMEWGLVWSGDPCIRGRAGWVGLVQGAAARPYGSAIGGGGWRGPELIGAEAGALHYVT
jgi:hypothetical protein